MSLVYIGVNTITNNNHLRQTDTRLTASFPAQPG